MYVLSVSLPLAGRESNSSRKTKSVHLLPLATRSISSFFLTAPELPADPYKKRDNQLGQIMRIQILTYLAGVDDLIGEGLRDGLEGPEGRLASGLADEVDGLVDSAEGRNIDSLSTHDTTGTDTGGVLAGTSVRDGSDKDLDGVLTGQKVDELHSLLDDPDGLLLLTVVPVAGGHEHGSKTLDDGALGLLEATLLVAASSVGDEDLLTDGADLEVVSKGVVGALHAIIRPPSEKLGSNSELKLVVFHFELRLVYMRES